MATKKKEEVVKYYCRVCSYPPNKPLPKAKFYSATNNDLDKSGVMSICKDCCTNIYKDYRKLFDVKKAIFLTCRDLDIAYSESSANGVLSSIENTVAKGDTYDETTVIGKYLSMLKTIGITNGIRGTRFRDSDNYIDEFGNTETAGQVYTDDDYEAIEIEYLKQRWGEEFVITDLVWLENDYNEWECGYEIDGKNRKTLVEQICCEDLFIYKERQKGIDVTRRLNNIQKLMTTAQLTPKLQSTSASSEFNSLPEMISHVEKHKPCYKPNHALKDVDHMKKWADMFEGTIARTQGKSNENTVLFEKEYEPETMNFDKIQGGE